MDISEANDMRLEALKATLEKAVRQGIITQDEADAKLAQGIREKETPM